MSFLGGKPKVPPVKKAIPPVRSAGKMEAEATEDERARRAKMRSNTLLTKGLLAEPDVNIPKGQKLG